MVDDTRLELVTSRTSSGCATSCANRPSAWIEYTRLAPLSSPFLRENEDSFLFDPSTSASPARSHDRRTGADERCSCLQRSEERLPPSSASRESGGCHLPRRGRQGRQTDCRTSDIGHWCGNDRREAKTSRVSGPEGMERRAWNVLSPWGKCCPVYPAGMR